MVLLTLLGAFDIGATFGVDDSVFNDKDRIEELFGRLKLRSKSETIRLYRPSLPLSVRDVFGAGLRMEVNDGLLIDAWRENARAIIKEGKYIYYFNNNDSITNPFSAERNSEECYNRFYEERDWMGAEKNFIDTEISTAQMSLCINFYSIGVAVVRLDVALSEESNEPKIKNAWFPIAQALEISGCGRFLGGDIDAMLPYNINSIDGLLKSISREFSTIYSEYVILRRSQARGGDSDAAVGYQAVVRCNDYHDIETILRSGEIYNDGESLRKINTYEAGVYLGWAVTIIVDQRWSTGFSADKVMYNLELCVAFYHVYWYFEWHLKNIIVSAVFYAEDPVQRQETLEIDKIKIVSETLCHVAIFDMVSEYVSDRALFREWDRISGISHMRERVNSKINSIIQYQSDADRSRREMAEQYVSSIIIIITAITTISVLKDAIDLFKEHADHGFGVFMAQKAARDDLAIAVLGVPLAITALTILIRWWVTQSRRWLRATRKRKAFQVLAAKKNEESSAEGNTRNKWAPPRGSVAERNRNIE